MSAMKKLISPHHLVKNMTRGILLSTECFPQDLARVRGGCQTAA
jgi:hypothetical protein